MRMLVVYPRFTFLGFLRLADRLGPRVLQVAAIPGRAADVSRLAKRLGADSTDSAEILT